MKVDSVQKQLKIFLTMLDADKPLRLTEISNLCRMSPQLTKSFSSTPLYSTSCQQR